MSLIEENRRRDEEWYNEITDMLNQIHTTINQLKALSMPSASIVWVVPAPNLAPTGNLELSNPQPTDELRSTVGRVTTDTQYQIGKKEGGMEGNSCKKISSRKSSIAGIPSLQGPGWEHLVHLGFTSANESDDEGKLTMHSKWHAAWVNNTFNAVDVAESK
ncbi:hypothetical protein FRC11_008563 [Ceratobasidium sp. 423]|nr:hypothetical protein FRC11_008563 [Ceratobasidium sp. 423]